MSVSGSSHMLEDFGAVFGQPRLQQPHLPRSRSKPLSLKQSVYFPLNPSRNPSQPLNLKDQMTLKGRGLIP